MVVVVVLVMVVVLAMALRWWPSHLAHAMVAVVVADGWTDKNIATSP